jgi:hypothetical protein
MQFRVAEFALNIFSDARVIALFDKARSISARTIFTINLTAMTTEMPGPAVITLINKLKGK